MPLIPTVRPGQTVALRQIDPGDTSGISHHDAQERVALLEEQLTSMQETLYAAGQQSILIILQGLDTAGKDGTIEHVMAAFNPSGCRVETFKVPTPIEAAHDFLWRAHRVTPPRGSISIFNRSYYEDVLVVRVHKLAPREEWEARYQQINDFESLLTSNGTIVIKFFLYVSKEEQRSRLEARRDDPLKAWKLSSSDWSEHKLYDDYVAAYEEALSRCSTESAPWYIVPADHKWFRNLAVAQTLFDRLRPDAARWEEEVRRRGETNLKSSAGAERAAKARVD